MDEIKYEWNDTRYKCKAQVNCSHFTSLPPLYLASAPICRALQKKWICTEHRVSFKVRPLCICQLRSNRSWKEALWTIEVRRAQWKFLFTECRTYCISVDSHHLMLSLLNAYTNLSFLADMQFICQRHWHLNTHCGMQKMHFTIIFSLIFLMHRVHTALHRAFGDHSYNL